MDGSADREGCKDGLLWYAYVNNNPMNFIDPTGLEGETYSSDYMNHDGEYNGNDPAEHTTSHTVQSGDELHQILEDLRPDLNDEEIGEYIDIVDEANDIINDPHHIGVGWEITIPGFDNSDDGGTGENNGGQALGPDPGPDNGDGDSSTGESSAAPNPGGGGRISGIPDGTAVTIESQGMYEVYDGFILDVEVGNNVGITEGNGNRNITITNWNKPVVSRTINISERFSISFSPMYSAFSISQNIGAYNEAWSFSLVNLSASYSKSENRDITVSDSLARNFHNLYNEGEVVNANVSACVEISLDFSGLLTLQSSHMSNAGIVIAGSSAMTNQALLRWLFY